MVARTVRDAGGDEIESHPIELIGTTSLGEGEALDDVRSLNSFRTPRDPTSLELVYDDELMHTPVSSCRRRAWDRAIRACSRGPARAHEREVLRYPPGSQSRNSRRSPEANEGEGNPC
jgi:hypothetical protein